MDTMIRGNWQGFVGSILSPRELEFTLGVAAGKTDKEMARETGLAPDTVRKRVYSAMFKLGASRRAQLIAEAMRRAIIAPLALLLAICGGAVHYSDNPHQLDRAQRIFRMQRQTARRDDFWPNTFDV